MQIISYNYVRYKYTKKKLDVNNFSKTDKQMLTNTLDMI